MRAAFVSISLLLSCGGSSAETKKPAPALHTWQPPPRKSKPPLPSGDFRGGNHPTPDIQRDSDVESAKKKVPDAVEAGPGVYTIALDNQQVRVLMASYQPGTKVPMHQHPDHVVFTVDGGAAVFEKAGAHEVDPGAASQVILVELGVKTGSAVPAGDDPVVKWPRVYKLVLDEARVRVLDVTYGKGRSRPVALGDHVLVARARGTLVVKAADGPARRLELEPGRVEFFPAGIYTSTNSKKESFEVVLFELKAP